MRPLPFHVGLIVLVGLLLLTPIATAADDDHADDLALSQRIAQLVQQLNAPQATQRDQAEQALRKLAPTQNADLCDAFLELLPTPTEKMPAEVQQRLARLRKQIETDQSTRALSASRLTLSADKMELAKVLDLLHAQTGNRLTDHREQLGQNTEPRQVTLQLNDEPFWPALDKILDAAHLTLYPFSGEASLGVINREATATPRATDASYSGPFRIQATNVVARRNLRSPEQQGVRLELEIAWEPRLHPIALSQSADALKVVADDGSSIPLASSQTLFNVEVQPGSHATELILPLVLPPRSVTHLASIQGKMSALVPGRIVEFQFKKLKNFKSSTQARGGVQVTLNRVRKSQDLWEFHMRLKVESAETGLESHRGWVFQNLTYLLNQQGELIDHAGFETTMQTKTEVGLTYLFDLPTDDLTAYTWVYRTPAAIVRLPIEYELKEIPLP